jgi:hypothetical protein
MQTEKVCSGFCIVVSFAVLTWAHACLLVVYALGECVIFEDSD